MFSKPAQQWGGKGGGMFGGDQRGPAKTFSSGGIASTGSATAGAASLPHATAPSFGGKGAQAPPRFGRAGATKPTSTGAGNGSPAWKNPQFGTGAGGDADHAKTQPGQPLFRSQQLVFGGARKGGPQQQQQQQQQQPQQPQQTTTFTAKAAHQQPQQHQRKPPSFHRQPSSTKPAAGSTQTLPTAQRTAGRGIRARLGSRDDAVAPTATASTTQRPAAQRSVLARLGGKDQQQQPTTFTGDVKPGEEAYAYGEGEMVGEEGEYDYDDEYAAEEGEEGGEWEGEEDDYGDYAEDDYDAEAEGEDQYDEANEEQGEYYEEEAPQPEQQQQQQQGQRSQAAMLFKQSTRGKPPASSAAAAKGKSIFDRLGKREPATTPPAGATSNSSAGTSAAKAPGATDEPKTQAAAKASRLFGKAAVTFGKKPSSSPTASSTTTTTTTTKAKTDTKSSGGAGARGVTSPALQPSQASASSPSSTLFSARLREKMQQEKKGTQQQQQQQQRQQPQSQREAAKKAFTMIRTTSSPPPSAVSAASVTPASVTTPTSRAPLPAPARTASPAPPLPPPTDHCPLSVGQVPGFANVRLMPKGLGGAGAGREGEEEGGDEDEEDEDEAALDRNPLVGGEMAGDRDKQRLDALETEVEREAKKLVQERRQLQTNGDASVGAIVGTCPTMCPEIERYRRFCSGAKTGNGGVWGFERTNGRFDHRKAIKEYRKEAADNLPEVPRQLRPPNLLHETMWFMVYHLMNRKMISEHKTASYRQRWYDFVEDRLRSIRKDMKTQRVFNSTTLQVVVMSIRFHCIAFYMLGDVWVDKSTNDQRLRDCYDTLAMHYREMRRTPEEVLPYEGEMRAYQLLHAIGQPGNVLQKIPHLMRDAHVKRAMAVLSCVPELGLRSARSQGSGLLNYPRFFRLVRSLPFIEACIAYASFDGVRQDALFQMAIASNRGRVPLPDFQRLLGFDGFDDATEFAEGHGLEVAHQRVVFKDKRIAIPGVLDRIKQRYRWLDALATDPFTGAPLSVGELVVGRRLGSRAKAAAGAQAASGAAMATAIPPAATTAPKEAPTKTQAAAAAAGLFGRRQQQQQQQQREKRTSATSSVPPSTPGSAAQGSGEVQVSIPPAADAEARRMVAQTMLHRKEGRRKGAAEKMAKPSPLMKHEEAAPTAVERHGAGNEMKEGAAAAKARALFGRAKPAAEEKKAAEERDKTAGTGEGGTLVRGAAMFKTSKERQQQQQQQQQQQREDEEMQKEVGAEAKKRKEREEKRLQEEEAERKRRQKEQQELERKRKEEARVAAERRRRLAHRMVLQEAVEDIIREECKRVVLWEDLIASFQRRRLVAAWNKWFKKFTDPYVTGKPLPVDEKNIVDVDPADIDPDAHLLQQRLRMQHLHQTLQHAHAGLSALTSALKRRCIKPRAVALQFTVIDLFQCPWDVASALAPEGADEHAVHPLSLDAGDGSAAGDDVDAAAGSSKRPKCSPTATASESPDCYASVRVRRVLPLDGSDSGLVPADDADALAASSVVVVSLLGAPDSVWTHAGRGQWVRLAFKLQPLLDMVPSSVPVLILHDSYGVAPADVATRLFAHLPFVHVQAVGLGAAELTSACRLQGRNAEKAGQVGAERVTAALASALTVAPLAAVVQVHADDLVEACFATQLNSGLWKDEETVSRRSVVDAHRNACGAALQALDTSAFSRHAPPSLVETIQRVNTPLAQWLRSSQVPRTLHTAARSVFDGHGDLPALRQEQQQLVNAWEAVVTSGAAGAGSAGGLGPHLARWLQAVCERNEKRLLAGERVVAPWREFASCLVVAMGTMVQDKVAYVDQTACEALEAAVADASRPTALSVTEEDAHSRAEDVMATRGARKAMSILGSSEMPRAKARGWTSVLQSRRWDEDVSAADRTLAMLAAGKGAQGQGQQRQQRYQLQAKRKGSVSSLRGHAQAEEGTMAARSRAVLPGKRPKMNTADLEASISELTSLIAEEAKAYGATDTLDRSVLSGDGGAFGDAHGHDAAVAAGSDGGRPAPAHQPAPPPPAPFVSALSPVRAAPATPRTPAEVPAKERAEADLETTQDRDAAGGRSSALLKELAMALRWEKQASDRLDQTIQQAM